MVHIALGQWNAAAESIEAGRTDPGKAAGPAGNPVLVDFRRGHFRERGSDRFLPWRAAGEAHVPQRMLLSISPRIVGTHLHHIKQKLAVGKQTELAPIAIRHGMIASREMRTSQDDACLR